ncbi:glycosyltransferase [Brevundimonas sp. VNH65]|uniref:glycosyltransferase n=1 Tax=Brevundimonas sp. VNH65 TaxID=3400917 RepID=UPI003BFBB365
MDLLIDHRVEVEFDEAWYVARYGDVEYAEFDPRTHWLKYGSRMGRDPSPDTPMAFYRQTHGHHAKAFENRTAGAFERLNEDPDLPADSQFVLKAASEIVETHGHDLALRLAERHLPEDLLGGLEALKANAAAAAGDFEGWTASINRYLAGQGLAPIMLDMSRPQLVDRFSCREVSRRTGGPLVTVLMPAFNAADTVMGAAGSILAQSWSNLELIIIDDASSDATWQRLQALAQTDPRVRILRNAENVGPYVSKNLGLRLARGQYVTGHDADDWAHPQRIERQVGFLQEAGEPFCLTGMLRLDADMKVTRFAKIGRNCFDGVGSAAFISLMIERRWLQGVYGFWDELRFGGDSELIHRIETVEARIIPRLPEFAMFAIDMPDGLTNHPDHGYAPGRPSAVRKSNRSKAARWHSSLDRSTAYLPFPHRPRKYPAEPESLNPHAKVAANLAVATESPAPERQLKAQVCIVTHLNFTGGNTSTTLEEIRVLRAGGVDIKVVHCPVAFSLKNGDHFDISDKFREHAEIIRHWWDVDGIECDDLIVRHPRVITSPAFARLAGGLRAGRAWYVINNSRHAISGGQVYDPDVLRQIIRRATPDSYALAPISPRIRAELLETFSDQELTATDWNPTFDVESHVGEVAEALTFPIVIGRHGRDGPEKWLEDPNELRAAYPADRDFQIHILGGAVIPQRRLGGLPKNWTVLDYGAIDPWTYLDQIDLFVYFPHTQWREAFGRTIVEALIRGRPVILPASFREHFGDMAYYAQPDEVRDVVREIVRGWVKTGRARQRDIQARAVEEFSSGAVERRFTS